MTVKLEICASGGNVSCAEFDLNDERLEGGGIVLPFSLPVSVTVKKADGTFAFTLRAECDIALSNARVILPLPKRDGFRILYYNAACCTNAFAGIHEYRGEACDNEFFSRDIFMAKLDASSVDIADAEAPFHVVTNLAFATFRRFYTRFRMKEGNVIAEYELENKTVSAGVDYELEQLFIDCEKEALDFFESYTDYLSKTHKIPAFKYIPKGWSSWSCYYGSINEERLLKQSELVKNEFSTLGANLIQLDDGWQKEGSFGGYWTTDYSKFPSGMKEVGKQLKDMGQRFGLWLAPGLIRDTSPLFEELKPYLVRQSDGSLLKCFGGSGSLSAEKDGSIYALDIGTPEVIKHTVEAFKRAKEDFKADYFKIDFITNLLYRTAFGTPVSYEGDYSVALYRKWISKIRETVGQDTFLLSCGAPVGESIEIFDAIRISPDISWGGAGKNGLPDAFEIITRDAQNVILRSPYHRKVFINDSDALLVRDFLTEYEDDALCLTDSEAKLRATVVLMSDGHILLNEEVDRLSPDRLSLVKQVFECSRKLSPITGNNAARPKDFFEYPYCTESYIKCNDGSILCALYNWDLFPKTKELDLSYYFAGDTHVLVKEVLTDEVLHDNACGTVSFNLEGHGSVLLWIIPRK